MLAPGGHTSGPSTPAPPSPVSLDAQVTLTSAPSRNLCLQGQNPEGLPTPLGLGDLAQWLERGSVDLGDGC